MTLLMTYWHGLIYALLVVVLVGYGWMMLADARRPNAKAGRPPTREKRR